MECSTYRRETTLILVIDFPVASSFIMVTHLAMTRVTGAKKKNIFFFSFPLPFKTYLWEMRKMLLL